MPVRGQPKEVFGAEWARDVCADRPAEPGGCVPLLGDQPVARLRGLPPRLGRYLVAVDLDGGLGPGRQVRHRDIRTGARSAKAFLQPAVPEATRGVGACLRRVVAWVFGDDD